MEFEKESIKVHIIFLGAYVFVIGGMIMAAFPEIQERVTLWLLHFL